MSSLSLYKDYGAGDKANDYVDKNKVKLFIQHLPDAELTTSPNLVGKLIDALGNNIVYTNPNNTSTHPYINVANVSTLDDIYYLQDLITGAKALGYTNDAIGTALRNAKITTPPGVKTWDKVAVKNYNTGFNAATQKIQDHLDKYYSDLNAYVSVIDGTKGYKIRITYKDPKTGTRVYKDVTDVKGVKNGKLSDDALVNELFGNSDFGKSINDALTYAHSKANVEANLTASKELAEAVDKALKGNTGANAVTNRQLDSGDIAAATAKKVDTSNLGAWNQLKDSNVLETLANNIANNTAGYDAIDRMSLTELQDYASKVAGATDTLNERNINTLRDNALDNITQGTVAQQLLQNIADQRKADSAKGIIAGQRAANAGAVTQATDAEADKIASDLYNNLFGSETSIADITRNNNQNAQTQALTAFVQGQLGKAGTVANQRLSDAEQIAAAVDVLVKALGVDLSKYDNAAAEASAAADSKTADRKQGIMGDAERDLARQDTNLRNVQDLLNIGQDYLQSAGNGQSDVAAALGVLKDAIGKGSGGGGYTKVTTPEYQAATQLSNKQYTDAVKNYGQFTTDTYIDALTKEVSLKDLLETFGLEFLTESGMQDKYRKYTEDANEKSDQVFNKAQRAYIAAVTAGDATTIDALTRLALSSNGGRGNLYAASALANQFKNQNNLNTVGRQLTTDFLNQQTKNQKALNDSVIAANTALTGFLGDGSSNKGGLYDIKSIFDQGTAAATKAYGGLGGQIMNTTQGINTSLVNQNIQNQDRLTQLAGVKTAANAAGAANNIKNKGTASTLNTTVQAQLKQAEADAKKYNIKLE